MGGTQIVTTWALVRRAPHRLFWAAVAGFGMQIWIVVEVMKIEGFHFLQALYFALGTVELILVLLLLGVHRPVRQS